MALMLRGMFFFQLRYFLRKSVELTLKILIFLLRN